MDKKKKNDNFIQCLLDFRLYHYICILPKKSDFTHFLLVDTYFVNNNFVETYHRYCNCCLCGRRVRILHKLFNNSDLLLDLKLDC